MRSAYDHHSTNRRADLLDSDSDRSSNSSGSDRSTRSYQTKATSCSSSPKKPLHVHYPTSNNRQKEAPQRYFHDRQLEESPPSSRRSSVASTVESEEEQERPDDPPEYDLPEYSAQPYESSAVVSTPSDFSELFPSNRRLIIRHDDSTLDGNMNLRLDTEVPIHGQDCDMTLFHLRMHDLKNREFSLRRYCRDSGREVCHSVRKHRKPAAERRPGIQRSLSNALHSMRPKPEQRSSTSPTVASLKRNDSGYGSMHSVDDEEERPKTAGDGGKPQEQSPTNTIKLEFSNYAQVDVKRTGVKGSKRHEFEYWGVNYAWKRVSRKDRGFKETSYHLTKAGSDRVLAYIMPARLTSQQADEERNKGGWIPPCSMQIADEQIIRSQKDVSDVVIASGLMALVDDSIQSHFHSKESKQLLVPVPKLHMGVEYVGPKRLINEAFNRKGSSPIQSRPSSSYRPSSSARQPSYEH